MTLLFINAAQLFIIMRENLMQVVYRQKILWIVTKIHHPIGINHTGQSAILDRGT